MGRLACTLMMLPVVVGAALPAGASADGSASLLRDCQDGHIDGHYAASDYRKALQTMPADVDEYSDCRDTIRAAQLHAAAGRGGGPPAGAGTQQVKASAAAAAARHPTPNGTAARSPAALAAVATPASTPPGVDVQPVAQRTPLAATPGSGRGPDLGRLAAALLVIAGCVALAGAYNSLRDDG